MNGPRSIFEAKRYGYVEIHLREMVEKRGLTRNQVATLSNTRFQIIDRWCKGQVERIDADLLARLCYVLDCELKDIIQYRRDD